MCVSVRDVRDVRVCVRCKDVCVRCEDVWTDRILKL